MRATAALVVLAAASAALAQEGAPPALVEASPISSEPVAQTVELPGTVRAVLDSLVASEVEGRVAVRAVDNGDSVARGEVLVRLDTVRLRKDLDMARAETAEARALLHVAARQETRARRLHEEEVVSDLDLDEAISQRESLEARIVALEARIADIEDDIARTEIRAPFAGAVTEVHTEVGEWIDQGDPVVRLSNLDTVEIRLEVPERYFPLLSVGDAAPATIGALPDLTLDGRIHALVPRADPEARTFPVIVRAANPQRQVAAGMLARVELELGEGQEALLVPKDAIVRQAQQEMVWVIDGDEVRPVSVRTGRAVDTRVEVIGDLQAGQSVVVKGNERLMPGQKVRIEPPNAPESAAAGS